MKSEQHFHTFIESWYSNTVYYLIVYSYEYVVKQKSQNVFRQNHYLLYEQDITLK